MSLTTALPPSVFTEVFPDSGKQGLTVAIKDCIDIAGHVTRSGSAAFADAEVAPAHAVIVDRLLDAGCTILGKTNMHELAYGMTGVNAHFGTPVNPTWPDRIPGGSSSGSAVAVAAGLVDFAIGTDTGGSVRQPAICCGVIGFKPSFGRVDRRGAAPAESSLDCIGPLARSIDMIERAMAIIDPTFVPQALSKAPRMGRLRTEFARDVGDALILPIMEQNFIPAFYTLPLLDEAFRAGMTLIGRETYRAFGHLLARPELLGADVRARLEAAALIADDAVAAAEDIRLRFTAEVDRALDEFDVLITPALPVIPPTLAEAAADPAVILPLTRYLRPFNLSGHPALVLPTTSVTGLPVGIQFVGRKGEDAYLCAVAAWFSAAVPQFQPKEETR
jgi:amidase